MNIIDRMHACKSVGELKKLVDANVNKWFTMKTMKKFGTYFKAQWLDRRFNKYKLFHRTVGLASTNCPIECYNGRKKGDFTDRSYFNLVFTCL